VSRAPNFNKKTTGIQQEMIFTHRTAARAASNGLARASRGLPGVLPIAATLAIAALLSGCGLSQLSSDGSNDKLVFPAPSSAMSKGGSFPLVEALRKLRPGMTKDQVAGLLGRPQYNEGFFGVREWDYQLNVTNDAGVPQMVCQLKTVFTSENTARNFYRKCGDAVETLVDGKWQKFEAAQTMTATPLTLDVTETSK
jgi:outer membrane protein assembly factor BamE (lipoprotein component of BamABCDE complex)